METNWQYVVSHDDRDIDYENLSWLSGDDAYHRMEEWSRIPFDGDNIPMNVIKMISLPGGYNGLYIKIDHRLMDSCGAIVMVNDYQHALILIGLPYKIMCAILDRKCRRYYKCL